MERKCYENEQYLRRECLEISGVPGSIADNAPEETLLNLFSQCKAPVDPSNVEDSHLLKSSNNAPQKGIVKLWKRKDVYQVLRVKNVKNLKNVDLNGTWIPPSTLIFVKQSLCRYYTFLWSKCQILWLNKIVESIWVSKSSCRIRLLDKSVKVITHIDDLKILFPGNLILEENSGNS